MNQNKVLYAVFNHGDDLIQAVEKVRIKGIEVIDCYTPYPVHGLDLAMGIKRSRLPIGAFICAMLGLTCAVSLQYYTMGYDWPIIIGGKPYVGLPSWIPVTFELSILFTAYGMGILFFIKSRMLHGMEADLIDLRQTDNKLIMAININGAEKLNDVEDLLKSNGATEIKYASDFGINSENEINIDSKSIDSQAKSKKAESNTGLSDEEKNIRLTAIFTKIGVANIKADDLKLIKGIGKVFENNLFSIGINSFEQIAKLDANTITLVEEVTKYFPGKIEREDWINQAKQLMKS